jgi:hypothetical protein
MSAGHADNKLAHQGRGSARLSRSCPLGRGGLPGSLHGPWTGDFQYGPVLRERVAWPEFRGCCLP